MKLLVKMSSVRAAFDFCAVVYSCSDVSHAPHARVFFNLKLVSDRSAHLACHHCVVSDVSEAREISSSNINIVAWDEDSELKLRAEARVGHQSAPVARAAALDPPGDAKQRRRSRLLDTETKT